MNEVEKQMNSIQSAMNQDLEIYELAKTSFDKSYIKISDERDVELHEKNFESRRLQFEKSANSIIRKFRLRVAQKLMPMDRCSYF